MKPNSTYSKHNAKSVALEARLRELRPDPPPPELRERCLPPGDLRSVNVAHLQQHRRKTMRNRILLSGAGGLAAAAAIALVALFLLPNSAGVSSASAKMLQDARAAIDAIDAVEVQTLWDGGDGTPDRGGWKGLIVRGLGARFENDGQLEIFNLPAQQHYRHEDGRPSIIRSRLRDDGLIDEMLRRCHLDKNVELLRVRALTRAGGLLEQSLDRDGVLVRRYSAIDENGRTIIVEIDVAARRLLRCESWTMPANDQPLTRIVELYSYPSPQNIDRRLFEPPAGVEVVDEPEDVQFRKQCMVNVRNMCMAVMLYASEHDNALPKSVDDLARYAAGGDLATACSCATASGQRVKIRYLGDQLQAATINDLDAKAILFECDLPDGKALGFGDGHAEFRPSP